jgi:hypothetical protein
VHLAQLNVAKLRAPIDDPEYVYKSEHVTFLRRRREWFEPYGPSVAMWWIDEGRIPSIEEAVERWTHLRDHGPSATAFGWRDVVEPATS